MERMDSRRKRTASVLNELHKQTKPQLEKMQICLSSTASMDIHPSNHPTFFTNQLYHALENKDNGQFYIRLINIAISGNFAPNSPPADSLQISIYEAEQQRQGVKFDQIVGSVELPPGNSYSLYYFKNSSPIPLRFQRLQKLQVSITNREGKQIILRKAQPPTILTLELIKGMEQHHFTITCKTFHPLTFPNNNLNEFTCPLPSQMELTNYEVALQNIGFPSDMLEDRTPFAITINKHIFRWPGPSAFRDTSQFEQSVKNVIETSELKDDIEFGVEVDRKTLTRHAYIKRKEKLVLIRAEDIHAYNHPIKVSPSIPFARACGQQWDIETHKELMPGEKWVFKGSPNINLAIPGSLVATHCSIIKPNLVGNTQTNLMQIIPIKTRIGNTLRKYYQPEQLIFHSVIARPFDTINFKLTELDGRPRQFYSNNVAASDMYITLLFRKKEGM